VRTASSFLKKCTREADVGQEHKKDPGIPNDFPFKDQLLAEVAEQRRIVGCAVFFFSAAADKVTPLNRLLRKRRNGRERREVKMDLCRLILRPKWMLTRRRLRHRR
jgi:hypothetical protein